MVSTTVDPHLPAPNHALLLGQFHQTPMQFRNHITTDRLPNAGQRLGVRHLVQADAREVTIGKVGAHLALQGVVAPVAHMLQQPQPQHDLSRCLRATSRTALCVPVTLSVEYAIDQLFIVEEFVGFDHPGFPESLHILGQNAFPQGPLRLFASRHASAYGPVETRSIVNVSAPPGHTFCQLAWPRALIFATESS